MLRLKVMPEGADPFEVRATTRDIAKWEKTTKGASFASFQKDMKMVDVYKVAYNAVTRTKTWVGTLADFEDTVDLDVLNEEDEAVDPTQPAPSAGT